MCLGNVYKHAQDPRVRAADSAGGERAQTRDPDSHGEVVPDDQIPMPTQGSTAERTISEHP